MKRFYKPISQEDLSNSNSIPDELPNSTSVLPERHNDSLTPKRSCIEINLEELPADPGLRIMISDYEPNIRDEIRRKYLQKGPCQPRNHNFSYKIYGSKSRRFNPAWFSKYANWLEYSVSKNAAFCLCCYLFKPDIGDQAGGESFVGEGFSNWKKAERLDIHVGSHGSSHNQAWRKCEALLSQKQHIMTFISKQSDDAKKEYRTRLVASIDCIRYLLRQGLPFRGNDESEESSNQGNFLELLRWLCDHNDNINNVAMKNAPENLKLTSPKIQKDIVNAISVEVVNTIIKEVGDSPFSILIDESRDISSKEQMAIVLRYVDEGNIVERFVGIEHVTSTSALSLKAAIDEFFSRHGLSISSLRGQGYDGASNMRGELNGLKALILKDNECAYYVHCFAHQLQLSLVAVAKNHIEIASLFNFTAKLVNIITGSAKRCDILREKHAATVFEALECGELLSGSGLNQETTLQRAGDTRWGSHFKTLVSVIKMFSSVVDVLLIIKEEGLTSDQQVEANVLLNLILSFSFVFSLHLMKTILGIANDLSQALQRKDQDIINAMKLVGICKQRLQMMREREWDSLFNEVASFCDKHHIEIPNMDAIYSVQGRSRRNVQAVTNMHHYRVELFYSVIDMQLQELNNRFNETNTELLLCIACLNPSDSFSTFDKQALLRLAKFYPKDFSEYDLTLLEDQLENYIIDMHSSIEFSRLNGIADLSQKMIKSKKDKVYPLVYLLIKLALLLPVATATVERAFSAMNILKTRLRNRMGGEFMNDNMILYIEKDIFDSIDVETIVQRFQNMKTRRGLL